VLDRAMFLDASNENIGHDLIQLVIKLKIVLFVLPI
jgi:hypothetical protein